MTLHPSQSWARGLLSALVLASCACSGAPPENDSDAGGDVGRPSGHDIGPIGNEDGGPPGSQDGSWRTEVCDGLDNDGDGIIDNVDADSDGICDCLRIATLGYPGKWGNGDIFTNWLNGKSLHGADSLGGKVLTEELLSPYHVIVVQDVRAGTPGVSGKARGIGRFYSQAEANVLKAWVQQGGGLMTLIGYDQPTEVDNVNLLLSGFGLAYLKKPILGRSGGSTVPVTHWEATHPLADGIQKVGVDNGYPVTGGTLIAWEPNKGDSDVGRAVTIGTGHVFAWGDEWITYDSEWRSHPDYQVQRFWLNTVKWLTRSDFCQVKIPPIFN